MDSDYFVTHYQILILFYLKCLSHMGEKTNLTIKNCIKRRHLTSYLNPFGRYYYYC